jgi:hypothetical protein
MAEPQAAAEAPSEGSSAPASLPSLFELIESVANDQVAEPTATIAVPAPPGAAAKPPPAGFDDPLDEARFNELMTKDPAAARALLQTEVKNALSLRRAAHNARAESERKETKLRATRDAVLGDKQATTAQTQLLQREIQDLQTGDPDKFIAAVGRLANARDPHEFWTKVAVALAQGKPVEAESAKPSKELEELRARQDRIEQERAAEIASREEQQILNLRVAQINEARTFADLGYVSSLANEQPVLVDARLVAIKQEHWDRTKQPLDTRSACGILENEIRSHFELLQRAGNPNGALNGERGAAAPVAGLAGKPELTAKPELAQRPPIHQAAVTAIPSALTAAPAATKRALSDAEQREAKIAELERLGLFSNFGM